VPDSQSPVRISGRYREGTLVLKTKFETSAGGRAVLADFMTPRPDGGSHLFRIIEGRRGRTRVLSLRNDVGLLAEMYDPRARRMVGNFPQAFSHVGMVNTGLQPEPA
jgi:hypothetical protein